MAGHYKVTKAWTTGHRHPLGPKVLSAAICFKKLWNHAGGQVSEPRKGPACMGLRGEGVSRPDGPGLPGIRGPLTRLEVEDIEGIRPAESLPEDHDPGARLLEGIRAVVCVGGREHLGTGAIEADSQSVEVDEG